MDAHLVGRRERKDVYTCNKQDDDGKEGEEMALVCVHLIKIRITLYLMPKLSPKNPLF